LQHLSGMSRREDLLGLALIKQCACRHLVGPISPQRLFVFSFLIVPKFR
jgi:hypothetical protein